MSVSKKIHRIFIDESGSPDIYKGGNNFGEKFFTLAAVIILEADYLVYKKEVNAISLKYNKYLAGHEIKSRNIRRGNPKGINPLELPLFEFYKYPDGQQYYDNFCNDLKTLIINTKFEVINVSTNKEIAQSLYPYMKILDTLLIDLWERIAIYHIVKKISKSLIIYDPKGNIDDLILESSHKEFMKTGSRFISTQITSAIKNLYKCALPCNSDDSIGLQLVDYFAYPLKSYAESKSITPFFRSVILPKLCKPVRDNIRGRNVFMSNKMSLNR